MKNSTFDEIASFVPDHQGLALSEITEDSGLERDLGISGDDAVELLVAFKKQFRADVSKFMAAEYFSAEGGINYWAILKWFGVNADHDKKNLKIKHLVKAAETGRLDEDVIKQSKRS